MTEQPPSDTPPEGTQATTTPEGSEGWVDPAGSAQTGQAATASNVAPDESPKVSEQSPAVDEQESGSAPSNAPAEEEAQHAHFLSTYEPVLTRLPDALGTSPEHDFVTVEQEQEQASAEGEAAEAANEGELPPPHEHTEPAE